MSRAAIAESESSDLTPSIEQITFGPKHHFFGYINHTLWNREDDRIYFYARGNFSQGGKERINVPFTVKPDGSGLTPLKTFIGGHPEWDYGHRVIGVLGDRQILYDVDRQLVVGAVGNSDIFPEPGADISLSPDGQWL